MNKFLALFLCIFSASPLFAAGVRLRFASRSVDPLAESLEETRSSDELIHPDKPQHYIVQFQKTPTPKLLKNLEGFGKFLNYFPDHAYVVKATPVQADALRAHPDVRWVGLYSSSFKFNPELLAVEFSAAGPTIVRVDLFVDAELKQTYDAIKQVGGEILKVFSDSRIRIQLSAGKIAELAQIPDVQWIEQEGKRTVRNSTTAWVIQSNQTSNTSVWNHGIHGEGEIAGHIDELINDTSCYLDQPNKIVARHNQSGGAVSEHGMNTAGTLVGDKTPYGSADNGDGNAFAAKITHRNLDDLITDVTLLDALQVNHNDGARVHSNSWGDDTTSSYTEDCHDADKFASDNEDDLVVFAISNGSSIKSPENAKNVLAVGASEQAPNQANHCDGGGGPTTDGRRKPELYAPGCGISTSGKSGCSLDSVSGTSLAAPAVAAGAILVRQYLRSGFYPSGTANAGDAINPTGALLKAMLINSAVDMTGVSGYPSNTEGWGRVLLENSLFFAGDSRSTIIRDVRHSNGFNTGDTSFDSYDFTVNSGDALRVTLVWTDIESPVGAQGTLINDLDLEVTTPNGVFKGNVFSGGQSSTGGNFDHVNNVEQVILNNPTAGNMTIKVTAHDIPVGPQGYALVVSGKASGGGGGGSTLFSDNSNDGDASDWSFLGKGSNGVVNNALELSGTRKETGIPPFAGCDDCTVSADVDASGFRGAIRFAFRDKANYREIRLDVERGRIVLLEKKNGTKVHKALIPQALNPGQVYHLEVQDAGPNVVASVDGAVVLNDNWGDIPAGEVEFYCKEGTCHFDNVLVEQ